MDSTEAAAMGFLPASTMTESDAGAGASAGCAAAILACTCAVVYPSGTTTTAAYSSWA
ncbi:MAG: hypothetical protein V8S24_14740 [Gordonibacter pamelaeae]